MGRHRLVIVDRGLGHVHRWKGRCDCGCGWVSRHRRRKKEVVKQYRQMVRSREAVMRGRATFTLVRPRPTTPLSQLPEALRSPAPAATQQQADQAKATERPHP